MKKRIGVLLALGVMTALAGLCAAEAEEGAPAGMIAGVAYMDDGDEDHMLDLFLDEDAEEEQPLILEIHGGGFFGGTKETNTDHARFYQNAGFAVAAPNYTHMPEADFRTIVGEMFTFLHWVEDNADAYRLDTDNVFMSGDSAGGFITLLTAAVLSSPELQDYYGVTPPSYAVKGYALTCPVTDLPALIRDFDEGKGFRNFMAGMMGEAVLKDEESVSHADLYQIIDPETFPAVYFLTTPTDDNFYGDSVSFDAFLTENGIEHVYREYVGSEGDLRHTFNVSEPNTADGQKANGDIVAYLKSLMN